MGWKGQAAEAACVGNEPELSINVGNDLNLR